MDRVVNLAKRFRAKNNDVKTLAENAEEFEIEAIETKEEIEKRIPVQSDFDIKEIPSLTVREYIWITAIITLSATLLGAAVTSLVSLFVS
jgi:hypothetical protein